MAGTLWRSLAPMLRAKALSLPGLCYPQSRAMCNHVGTGSGGRCGGWAVRSPPDDIPFAVKGLKHIAIAVPDLSAAAEHYRSAFGAQVSDPVDQPNLGVTVVFVQLANVAIELLHPLGEQSPVFSFLQMNPKGGIHHISLAVDDLHSAAGHLDKVGVKSLSDCGPTLGAENRPVLFLHPLDNMGVLIELQQANHSHAVEHMAKVVAIY